MNHMGSCRKMVFCGRALAGVTASAPGPSATGIKARKAFTHEHSAKAFAAARQYAQLAAITVGIAVDRLQRKWPRIDQLMHPPCGRCAQLCLQWASGAVGFGGVDVGNADFDAAIMDRVAIDDAVGAAAAVAQAKGRRFGVACAGRGRCKARQAQKCRCCCGEDNVA